MQFVFEISGLQNAEQVIPDPAASAALRDLGFQVGFVQHFAVKTSPLVPPEPTESLSATSLRSNAIVFPDDDAARKALAYLRSNPPPGLDDVRVRDVSLGAGGYRLSARGESSRIASVSWRQDNALMSVSAEAAKAAPKEKPLLDLARKVAGAPERAKPTGEDVRIPAPVQPGERVFFDNLEDASGWERTSEGGKHLTTYLSGGLSIATDGPGSRWNDTSKFDDASVGVLDEIVVEADAQLLQGRETRWGLMCRVAFAGYYLFLVGNDGFVGIYRAPTRVNNPLPLATMMLPDRIQQPHRLRADCAGDPVARLRLYANDQLLLEAYDDDPLGPGAVGLWVESRRDPAAVLFDNVSVSEAITSGD